MTMVMEHGHRQYGGMGYEGVYQGPVQPHPHQHYGDGWSAPVSSHPHPSVYPTSMPATNSGKREIMQRPVPPAISVSYSTVPVSAPSMIPNGNYGSVQYGGSEMLVLPPDMPRTSLEQSQASTTTSPIHNFSPGGYSPLDYAHPLHQQQQQQQPQNTGHHHPQPIHQDAKSLHQMQVVPQPHTQSTPPAQTSNGFGDALDASRGMVALSQDLTPRGVYGPRTTRTTAESYGFPTAPSSASSISSANNYPYYSASVVSVDSSVTDYSSTTSESYDGFASRTLPRPSGLLGAMPPGPQSMMGHFSTKVPANTQKKHKCKVCDKRFTRPSSLQTHMYSHTGEKPYACDVEGCGRHFSVVSNLRRHKKVHKGEKDSGSPEDEE
ncbi:hypothetical protein FQN57_006856 [Myotisia sp. PD_48]|nr:hypothetical protein FQN57_006856 [Myotisia sp. PD_48]